MRGGRIALLAVLLALTAAAPAAAGGFSLTRAERSLLAEMNRVRSAHGLTPLRVGYRLQRAARAHSFDMLRNGYFAHGPFLSRLLAEGAVGPAFGENLAWGSGELGRPAVIVGLWLGSGGHRANLLRPGFERVGVAAPTGTYRGVPGVRMVTADFAGR